jgi:hypothetical protein
VKIDPFDLVLNILLANPLPVYGDGQNSSEIGCMLSTKCRALDVGNSAWEKKPAKTPNTVRKQ